MSVKPIPEGQPRIVPHLTINGGKAKDAITFYQEAFGAELVYASEMPDGRVLHAQLRIADGVIFLNDEFRPGPEVTPGGVAINLWTEDAAGLWERAVKAGAEVQMPLMDAFWGSRYGALADPFGHTWAVSQQVEDVAPGEIARRAEEWFADMAEQGMPE